MRAHIAIVIALLFVISSRFAHADEDGKNRAYIGAGTASIVVGVLSLAAGAALTGFAASDAKSCNGNGDCSVADVIPTLGGIALVTSAAIHLGVGIPLVAMGASRRKAASWKTTGIGVAVAPTRDGARGALTFRF